METVVNSIRVPADVAAAYDDLARQTGRTRNYLYVEALREYLSWEREEAALLERSVAEADRGETVSLEEANDGTRALVARLGIGPERLEQIRAEEAAAADAQMAIS